MHVLLHGTPPEIAYPGDQPHATALTVVGVVAGARVREDRDCLTWGLCCPLLPRHVEDAGAHSGPQVPCHVSDLPSYLMECGAQPALRSLCAMLIPSRSRPLR